LPGILLEHLRVCKGEATLRYNQAWRLLRQLVPPRNDKSYGGPGGRAPWRWRWGCAFPT